MACGATRYDIYRERIAKLEAQQDQLLQFISELRLTEKQILRFCELTKIDRAALLREE